MDRNFPTGRMRYRFRVWQDRRRYPWRYPEEDSRRSRRAARAFQRRFFVIRYTGEGDGSEPYIFAECPDYVAASEVAVRTGARVFTHRQMGEYPELRRVLKYWDSEDPRRSPRRTLSDERRQDVVQLSPVRESDDRTRVSGSRDLGDR